MSDIPERYCIVDVETYTPTGKPDPDKDIIRYVGFRSFSGNNRIYHISQTKEIQQALDAFDYFVGHNNIGYDKIVLENNGFHTRGIWIDTLVITEKRAKQMMYLDLNQGDKSLKRLCEIFKLSEHKGEFNYDLLEKEILEGEDYESLVKYLTGDLVCSDLLFQYYYNLFIGFKELVSEKDQRKMSWLVCSAGTTAYKAICNMAELPEEYDDNATMKNKAYDGAFVSTPDRDMVEGDIHCFDAASLYPHMYIMGNLFSPATKQQHWNGECWNGSGLYPNEYINDEDGIKGVYHNKQGKIEQVIERLYNWRKDIPKSNPLNLAIKIVINTMYGISGSPRFKSVYNLTTASDCTAMARRTIKYARRRISNDGYDALYTDTDSIYILDPFKDERKLKELCMEIGDSLVECANIPAITFKFAHECKIKRMYFFRDDSGEFVKKHYIYIKDDDKMVIKGLKIIQGNCSPLAKLVFEKYIKPSIQDGTFKPLNKDTVLDLFRIEAKQNPDLIVKRYRVWDIETYKKKENGDESTSLHAQISKRYGKGEWWLVCNKHLGPGKGNHYCKVEELQAKYGESWIDHVWIDYYAKDLSEFVDWKQRKQLHKGEPE